MEALALSAIMDRGSMAVIRGWDGPSERLITLHKISSTSFATSTALFKRLVQQVEQGVLTLRVANVFPADQALPRHIANSQMVEYADVWFMHR